MLNRATSLPLKIVSMFRMDLLQGARRICAEKRVGRVTSIEQCWSRGLCCRTQAPQALAGARGNEESRIGQRANECLHDHRIRYLHFEQVVGNPKPRSGVSRLGEDPIVFTSIFQHRLNGAEVASRSACRLPTGDTADCQSALRGWRLRKTRMCEISRRAPKPE